MKTILVLIFFIVAIAHAFAQRYNLTVRVDGHVREFIVLVPSASAPAEGYPVVVVLHGSNHQGEDILGTSGWDVVGEENGIVTVYPSSLRWCFDAHDGTGPYHPYKWVAGETHDLVCDTNDLISDVHFLEELIDTIASVVRIDRELLFLTGMSNGGVMSAKIAMDAPRLFKAIAPCGSMMHTNDIALPLNPPPAWNCFGTHDGFFIAPGFESVPFNDSVLVYLRNSLRLWLNAYQLSQTEYTKDSTALALTYTFSTPLAGAPPAMYRFSVVKGLGHEYANGDNHQLYYARAFWQFFLASANPNSVDDIGDKGHVVRVYPNPASDELVFEVSQPNALLQIVDVLGRVVYATNVQDVRTMINVGAWTRGMYIVRFNNMSQVLLVK